MIMLKSKREIEFMRQAGRIVAETHRVVSSAISLGVTTGELDRIAEEYIINCGAVPAFKGYEGFPASICVSVNEQVIHGIPGMLSLKEGDIASIDIGVLYKGYYGDAAKTYPVGRVTAGAMDLIQVTEEAFFEGLKYARPEYRLSDISHAIQKYAEERGYSVVKKFVGHGIGLSMHEEPKVPNYGPPGKGIRLRPGMTLAVEPMINEGADRVTLLNDGWTVVTEDGCLSAHFEHTLAISDGEPIILTMEE